MKNSIRNFVGESGSRETSPEILEAIYQLACEADPDNAYRAANSIWENGFKRDVEQIVERVTKGGSVDPRTLCWGSAGYCWAEES